MPLYKIISVSVNLLAKTELLSMKILSFYWVFSNLNNNYDHLLECEPLPSNHHQGSFLCQTKNFAADNACKYTCSGSKVPEKTTSTTCKAVTNSSGSVVGYEWEPKVQTGPDNKFACVATMK